jgi:2,4-dienoyl-CoA reductase-like NADH-dependent reductase (Old Yellow Enzyme family)
MKSIFDRISIGAIESKNRVLRSATAELYADSEGRITDTYLRVFEDLASGGTGVIITGMVDVDVSNRFSGRMLDISKEGFVEDIRKAKELAHAHDTKLVVQIVHCGAKAAAGEGTLPMGPSDVAMMKDRPSRPMTKGEIEKVVAEFAFAAGKCKEAGADGVQIHGAHGYLISQFLSPYSNKRTDEYGGGIENRGRIALEILDAMRSEAGSSYPIWIKINCTDLVDESITLEECIWLCKQMESHGLSAIELSAGRGMRRSSSPSKVIVREQDEGSFASEAVVLAEEVGIPVISTGGFRSLGMMERWLNKGNIIALGLSRPLICEPGLIKRWQGGQTEKSRCVSCNKCYRLRDGLQCQVGDSTITA